MKFSVEEDFGSEIRKIWDDHKFDSIDLKNRGFAVHDDIQQNSLMFIGINSSYNGSTGNLFYENSHRETHKYFKKFIEISSEVGLKWSHLDLLFLRETNQKEVKSLGENNLGHIFYDEQFKMAVSSKLNCRRKKLFENKFKPKFNANENHNNINSYYRILYILVLGKQIDKL